METLSSLKLGHNTVSVTHFFRILFANVPIIVYTSHDYLIVKGASSMDQFASFLVLVLFLILVGLIAFYVIPERARYRRMKVRAFQSLEYAKHLAKHFGVSRPTLNAALARLSPSDT